LDDLMVDIRDWSLEVADTILQIRDVRSGIEGRRNGLTEKFGTEIDAVLKELRQIEGILVVWAGTEAHPMMYGPPGLTEKLNSLSNVISSSDARPTASMYAVFEELQNSLEIQQNRLNDLVEQRLTPLLSGR
jgi:hypothetical protein